MASETRPGLSVMIGEPMFEQVQQGQPAKVESITGVMEFSRIKHLLSDKPLRRPNPHAHPQK